MARSTGPILAVGAITIANKSIVNDSPMDWRIPVATGLSAGAFALMEKAWADAAVSLSWLALVAVLFVRLDPKQKAPLEAFTDWLEK